MQQILNSIDDIFNNFAPCVFVEVIKTTSGTPCKAGFKMIVNEEGRLQGSVGGGVLEKTCIEIAQKMISDNEKISIYTFTLKDDLPISQEKDTLKLSNESNEKVNLYAACGGCVTIFFEYHGVLTLSIFGAGHIGQNLIEIINGLDYKIQLFDVREDALLSFKDKNNIKTYLLKPFEENGIQSFFVGDKPLKDFLQHESFVVITTHGHTYDFSIAKYILNLDKKFKYIGMIGSKNKIREFKEKLKENDPVIFEKLLKSNFYSPIGLDIGGVSAREIALSIASQIQAIRYNKNIKDLSIIKL